MKIRKPDTVTKSEWKRFRKLASRNMYLGTAPVPDVKGTGDLEFLSLLRKCQEGGLILKEIEQYEDDCPICIEDMKMVVLIALHPELATKRKFSMTKTNYDDMGEFGQMLRRMVAINGPMAHFPEAS